MDDGAGRRARLAAIGRVAGSSVSYWADIFPFIVLMSLGMGAMFVPMTLTAVHRVRGRDSGIGSGVLNTMQQVGGALGLATLSTVATSTMTSKAEDLAPAIGEGLNQAAAQDPGLLDRLMGVFRVDSVDQVVGQVAALGAFPDGATSAFFVGTFMMLAGSAVVWLFLNVKHEELATDGPEGVHVG